MLSPPRRGSMAIKATCRCGCAMIIRIFARPVRSYRVTSGGARPQDGVSKFCRTLDPYPRASLGMGVQGFENVSALREVTEEAGLSRHSLNELVQNRELPLPPIARLLDAMKKHSRPVEPKRLGVIGQEHLRASCEAQGVEMEVDLMCPSMSNPSVAATIHRNVDDNTFMSPALRVLPLLPISPFQMPFLTAVDPRFPTTFLFQSTENKEKPCFWRVFSYQINRTPISKPGSANKDVTTIFLTLCHYCAIRGTEITTEWGCDNGCNVCEGPLCPCERWHW